MAKLAACCSSVESTAIAFTDWLIQLTGLATSAITKELNWGSFITESMSASTMAQLVGVKLQLAEATAEYQPKYATIEEQLVEFTVVRQLVGASVDYQGLEPGWTSTP